MFCFFWFFDYVPVNTVHIVHTKIPDQLVNIKTSSMETLKDLQLQIQVAYIN